MSFVKFVDLIAKEKLYFSRLDHQEDSWEGLIPIGIKAEERTYIRYNKYINCWHMNDDESDSMWKLYGNPEGETVAIKTNVGRLIQSLESCPDDVFIGKIKYEEQHVSKNNLYHPLLHKRKPFRNENELRLCVSGSNCNPPDVMQLNSALMSFGENLSGINFLKMIGDKGHFVDVHLEQLIENIFLSPSSNQLLLDSVLYVINGKLSCNKIKESALIK
jgi:hypothetical protein